MSLVNFQFFSFLILIIYLGWSLWYFQFRTEKYELNQQSIRKIYYGLVFALIFIGISIGEIQVNDWNAILQLVIIAIFIDLALFQTPDILKILGAEFQHGNYIRKTLLKNERTLNFSAKKVQKFNEIMSYTESYFENDPLISNWKHHKHLLKDYLYEYADSFQLHLHIINVPISENDDELLASITSAFTNIESYHAFTLREEREERLEELLSGITIEVKGTTEESFMVIPYYGSRYNMLISITGSGQIQADSIDAAHILNLAYVFDWWHTP